MRLINSTYLDENFNLATGNLVVSDGKVWIVDGDAADLGKSVLDCSDYVIIPGLINAHFHGYSLSAKGLAKDKKIEQWSGDDPQGRIQQKYFDNLDKLTSDEYQILCIKAYIDMAKKGITFVSESEPGYWPDVVAEAINHVGMRGLVDTYSEIASFYGRIDGNVQYGTHLLEEEDITDEALQTCIDSKRAHNSLFLTHCMENDWRRELIYTKYNRSSLQLYKEKELLDASTILFHAVYVNPADIDLIAEAGASIVHCPVANLWSGAGIAPVSSMLDRGVNVCLGTDYASTDIWEVMRMAYYLLKYNVPVNRFKAEDIFKMSTSNGAKAYQQDSLGKIGNGMFADLVFIRKNQLIPEVHSHDFSTIAHNLLFETQEDSIHHVMVGGKWVMYDRKMTKVDEEAVSAKYKALMNKIYASIS